MQVTVSKRRVVWAVLAFSIFVSLIVTAPAIVGRLRDTATAAQVEVEAAAAHAIGEALRFDHTEGQEAWAGRVEPLCTETGWSFWNLVAVQTWPQVMEQEYAVQSSEVLGAEVVEEDSDPDRVTVSVRLRIEYVQEGETRTEENVYPVVMVEQDGRWLMDVGDL